MKSFLLSIVVIALSFSLGYASIIDHKPTPPIKPSPVHPKPAPPKPSAPAPAHFSTNLTEFTKDHITAIFQPNLKQAVFNNSIHCFFDDAIDIQFNGIATTLDQFTNDIILDKTDQVGLTIDWISAVEVPANNSNPFNAGSVGLYYNTTVIRSVNGTTINSWVVANINLVISPDDSSKLDCSGDSRRVKTLTRVSLPPEEVVGNLTQKA